MVSSTRRAIASTLIVLSAAIYVGAQTPAQKVATASISGKVTIKGKPAVGVMILATDSRDYGRSNMTGYRAKTDQTGSYRLISLPAGTYEISAVTPSLVSADQLNSIVISDSEEIEDVNLVLVPGGVITGRITDSDGKPIIGTFVRMGLLDDHQIPRRLSRAQMTRFFFDNVTDDRGVYRAFGLPPGKYKVSAGESASGRKSSRQYYKETFYPSVTDAAKATIIEVTEGSEAKDVDIVMGRPVETFNVAGRVVDRETGRPIPNVRYGVGQRIVEDQNSTSVSSSSGSDATNANGEFRLENVTPGTYTIFTVAPDGNDRTAASVTFEVIDRDVAGLLIKTTRGSSLSGVVVLDGNERSPALFSSVRINVAVESKDGFFTNSRSSAVDQQGTFSINGVGSGLAHLGIYSIGDERKQFEIVRIERNGIPSETINVNAGDHVTGLRVLVKYMKLTGAIRGEVKVEDGELPPISQLSLSLWPLDENLQPKSSHSVGSPKLDARGRFVAEGLPAGTYRLTVLVYDTAQPTTGTRIAEEKIQRVAVTDDTVTEVTLIIKPQPISKKH